jgi:hypothetical protein
LAFRRDVKRSFPVVEGNIQWADPKFGSFLGFRLVIRNQLYETVVFESAKVRKPRGALFAEQKRNDFYGDIIGLEKGNSDSIAQSREISPIGSASGFMAPPGQVRRVDIYVESFYLSLPENWDGGKVRVDLWLSSKALTIRHRREKVKRRISPRPSKQTDEKAKSHA